MSSKERLKRIAACLILFSWLLALIVFAMLAFGVRPVLAGFGMGILIVGSVRITVWAWDTLFGEYPTHYGADPP